MSRINKHIKSFIFLAMFMATANGFSQVQLQEEILLHLDRAYYLAGEHIQFAVYCNEKTSGKATRLSSMLYLELLNAEGVILHQEKVSLKDGRGWGKFPIPPDVSSSEHIIRSYTSWMKNFGPNSFHYTTILIIHPAKEYKTTVKDNKNPPPRSDARPALEGLPLVNIEGLMKTYCTRDSIEFRLQTRSATGGIQSACLSISVARSESQYPSSFGAPRVLPESDPPLPDWNKLKYLPDMQGLHVSGILKKQGTKEPVANADVLLSLIDTITEIYSTKSNAEGRFRIELHDIHGIKDMIIQVPGDDSNTEITIDPDRNMEKIPDYAWKSLYRDSLESQFEKMLLEQQLSAAYHLSPASNDAMLAIHPPAREPLSFYGRPDHEIVMENYINLPVMEEVFRELGKRVFLTRESGSYKVRILDLETNRIIGDQPYFFLDGVPFFDSEQLLSLDPSQVLSISLKSRKYFMGDLVMDGIIDIRSVSGDASMMELPRSAIRLYFPGYADDMNGIEKRSPSADRRIPYYETTLLFEPLVRTGKNEAAIIKLIAPDSKGSYSIAVRGLTPDGIPIEQNFSFEVR